MKLKTQVTRIALAVGVLCLASVVQAQIYEMSYTDTNGALQVKGPAVTWYSTNSDVVVTAISGLDRKVKLELVKGTTVVQSQTSGLITVANRITAADGKEFYGTKFTLTRPADGNYTLRSTVLDINNAVVTATNYTFNVDTVGPYSTQAFSFTVGGGTGGSVAVFGPDSGGNSINLNGIVDDGSGVASATYYTIDSAGTKREKATTLTSTTPANWNVKANWASASNVTPTQGLYTIGLAMTDVAGNIGKKENQSYIDPILPPLESEIWNSSTGLWQPLAGAVSYENPVKVRVKIPKTDHVNFNGTNYGFVQSPHSTDATYAYYQYTASAPSSYGYWRFTTKAGLYRDVQTSVVNSVTLLGSAAPGPAYTNMQYGVVGKAMVNSGWVRFSVPTTVDRVTVNVAARSYPQKITVNNANCVVPIDGTTCTMDPLVSYTTGRGYIPYTINITNTVNTSQSVNVGYFYTYWDFNPPVIDDFTYTSDARKLFLYVTDNDRTDNWQLSAWDTRDFTVKATNSANQVFTMPLITSRDESYKNKYAEFNTASLAEGVYDFTATATDTYGNAATRTLSGVVVDSTGPSISVTNKGGSMTSVETIKDFRVSLEDSVDPEPVITSMSLVGGPINDKLLLGYSKLSDGWQPEVPRMFPTLKPGQEYTFKVEAKDFQGNKSTYSKTFSLTQQNLVEADGVSVMAVSKSLMDSHDQPLGMVEFKAALTDGGTQSRGPQAGYITLRSDAAFGVIFNGQPVQPGETKDVVIPLDVEGMAKLPVWPATSGTNGVASYMIDIPQLVAN